ncbi:MAG: MotA/TolQ/ExbB proton channel family protein [Alphaproteobacteria bacterium]|nr:MotA/TolQ/ExbB proton channel family protein [Alphaproteobacteria bacterium]
MSEQPATKSSVPRTSFSARRSDLMFQIATFLVSVVVVHTVYLLSILPEAERQMRLAAEQNIGVVRSMSIILKDPEQEICMILLLWATCIIGRKISDQLVLRHFLEVDLIERADEAVVTQSTARRALDGLWALSHPAQDATVVQALIAGLQRFVATGSIQNASDAVKEYGDSVGMRMEAELSMVRYIIWAIPSVGFIGTVRGIGDALSQAQTALAGNIAGMTNSLGVAFNSTFVALLISIFLMFLMHQLQLLQDKALLDAQDYCDRMFLKHLTETR